MRINQCIAERNLIFVSLISPRCRRSSRACLGLSPPELSCALAGTLTRGFLSRRPASERAVELIEQRQAHLWSTPCGAQPIVVLGIKLRERYGGPLLHQLVQTYTACPREVLETLSL